ncbi:hypothetical protein RUM43_014940 [Polyplax serrata]|uniref:Uncharacterized protein n=1 Tax=Polyplax serrata TaxID=468196 RepID=A0AAN8P0S0_POLSC
MDQVERQKPVGRRSAGGQGRDVKPSGITLSYAGVIRSGDIQLRFQTPQQESFQGSPWKIERLGLQRFS